MKILIHACPQRMWYVEEFLVPELRSQGAEDIEIWCDRERRSNLRACMDSFAARKGDGGTWHLQDDVLPCSDFVRRCEELDEGVAYGFACRNFGDRLDAWGLVYAPDAWHSFQCLRIPDAYARECAAWVRSEKWRRQSAVSGSGKEAEQNKKGPAPRKRCRSFLEGLSGLLANTSPPESESADSAARPAYSRSASVP